MKAVVDCQDDHSTSQFFLTRGEVCFPTVWIWAGLRTFLDQQNMVEATACRFQARSQEVLQFSLLLPLELNHRACQLRLACSRVRDQVRHRWAFSADLLLDQQAPSQVSEQNCPAEPRTNGPFREFWTKKLLPFLSHYILGRGVTQQVITDPRSNILKLFYAKHRSKSHLLAFVSTGMVSFVLFFICKGGPDNSSAKSACFGIKLGLSLENWDVWPLRSAVL